jgi:hypothetical protein
LKLPNTLLFFSTPRVELLRVELCIDVDCSCSGAMEASFSRECDCSMYGYGKWSYREGHTTLIFISGHARRRRLR